MINEIKLPLTWGNQVMKVIPTAPYSFIIVKKKLTKRLNPVYTKFKLIQSRSHNSTSGNVL